MKEPKTSAEAQLLFVDILNAKPEVAFRAFLVLLDTLVDLACAGGSPVPNRAMQEFVRLRFYKSVLGELVRMGIAE